jgi:hypothetical protein
MGRQGRAPTILQSDPGPTSQQSDSPFVTRARVWRGGGAPSVLAMDVTLPPIAVAARLLFGTGPAGVLLFPAFPQVVARLRVTR